jgi:serine/threonine-protein kinase
MRLEVGARFARYTIEASLGDGGMGQVYRAFDVKLQRRLALKILIKNEGQSPGEEDRSAALILREARAAAALHHPNVVTVFEVDAHDGVPYMTMEFVPGRSLRSLVGHPDVPLEQRIRWLLDIAKALAAAHQAGIVHLDMKPENVIVRDDGVAKVLDFGIARRGSQGGDGSQTSATDPTEPDALAPITKGPVAGTPRYMAPEHVRHQDLDGRTDQFAWGVLAFELLTGRYPWDSQGNLFDLFTAIVGLPLPPLRSYCPVVPEELERVVSRATSKSRDDRFPSMTEIAQRIAALLSNSPLPDADERPSWSLPNARVHVLQEHTLDQTERDPSIPAPLPQVRASVLPFIHSPSGSPASVSQPPPEAPATSAPSKPPPRLSARRLVTLFGALVGATLAIALGVYFNYFNGRSLSPGKPAEAVALLAAFPAPTAITDLPPPRRCNAEALDAYRGALQAIRDGVWEQADIKLERAVELDPGCAEAHLRLALTTWSSSQGPTRARDIYRRALELRADLSPRDQGLLQALEPMFRGTPPDVRSTIQRLESLSEQYPGDAELALLPSDYAGDKDLTTDRTRRALVLDPHYSDAWQRLGRLLALAGRVDEAVATFEQCLKNAPNSVDCPAELAALQRRAGRCDALAGTARLLIARNPGSSRGYKTLAAALAAEDKPRKAVYDALVQRWARLSEPVRRREQLLEQARLDILNGDFGGAEAKVLELTHLVEADPDLEPHVVPALLLAYLMLETGREAKAGEIAGDVLARKSAWEANRSFLRFNLRTHDFELRMLQVERIAGVLPESEWTAARARWMDSARSANIMASEDIWVAAMAMPVMSSEEAREAVQSMPASLGSRPAWQVIRTLELSSAFIGHALLEAGRVKEAQTYLREATASCFEIDEPITHTQAHLWLGQALEQEGDTGGACQAYEVVVKRWGREPSSKSAALAKKRVKALGCGER